MEKTLFLLLGLIIAVSFLVLIAQRLKIAYPILLVIAGLVLGFLPQVPNVHIDPNLVFFIVLPPILFDAAQDISWKALWKWRRIVTVMAFGYVLLTAAAVAFLSVWLIPGFTLSQGFLLGAIVSPPDAAAATSVLRYVKLPKGVVSILQGESLLNDAASLTLFRFALIAITSNNFVWHQAATGFLFITCSGIAVGLVIGFAFYAIYRWLPTTANLDIALSLALPYLLYLTAESFESSGVLAVVSGGLFIAYHNHFVFSHSSRLKSNAIWSSIVFILNAVIFLIIGLQLPVIIYGLKELPFLQALGLAAIITLAIILVRMLSGFTSSWFTVFISKYIKVAQNRPGWRNPAVMSWVGMRGVVSLASALSIPLMLSGGKPFPHRDLILFITYVVIIITLVFQGLTLPWVIRKIKPESFPGDKPDGQQLSEIEAEMYASALKRIDEQYKKDTEANRLIKNRVEQWRLKQELFSEIHDDEDKRKEAKAIIKQFKTVIIDLLEHERKELHAFRKIDGYDDDIIRKIENQLDLEEQRIQQNDE
ncbi:Na+/H+ antiporter [Mucilaginibacter koreensis]